MRQSEVVPMPKRAKRDAVVIHLFNNYDYLELAREYAEALGMGYDCEGIGDGRYAFAVSGTLMQVACMQAYINGLLHV